MHTYSFQGRTLSFQRYPATDNRSLRPWSAADEHILQYIEPLLEERDDELPSIGIYHDRFGFLGHLLFPYKVKGVAVFRSQQKAWRVNHELNGGQGISPASIHDPLNKLPEKIDLALIRVPKSLDLFQLYLEHIHANLHPGGGVVAGFMTKHFSPQLLRIAERYFEEVEQSKAWKKSRILRMRGKKDQPKLVPIHTIHWTLPTGEPLRIQQYYGVFSAKQIDYASQFLIEHLEVKPNEKCILDLASGNGILALAIRQQQAAAELHLMDDSYLAIESSKLNLSPEHTYFHNTDTLDDLYDQTFDLVVSNPPFHFDHENNIEVALSLFKGVADHLQDGGRFVLVANRHLNYRTHLIRLFNKVQVVAENQRYIIYECKQQ